MFQIGSMDRVCSCIIAASYGISSTLDVLIKLLKHIVNILYVIKKNYIYNFVLFTINYSIEKRNKETY